MKIDGQTGRVSLEAEETQEWVEVALNARVMQVVLRNIQAPAPHSMLHTVGAFYPDELAGEWTRSFLSSSLEHLVMWADYATPLIYHPDAKVEFALRPAQTLSRAALEAASQAVWILAPTHSSEMARRHMSLVLADWDEQKKATTDLSSKESFKQRRAAALRLLGGPESDFKAPTYLALVTEAAAHVREQLPTAGVPDPTTVERLWRTSAGSAHGKRWPASELTMDIEMNGWHISMPDPTAISAILRLADRVMTYGIMRFAESSGHHDQLAELQHEALKETYQRVPKLPGAPAGLPPRKK